MANPIYRFSAFELDPDRRTLRLDGRDLSLQPRVFDLLRYLVEHRDRVVAKEELLEALWPGVVVTDSSLQRAVSLARAVLQQGGPENAIRNYARRGYRFIAAETADDPATGSTGNDAQATAEHSYAAARWLDAMRQYADADRAQPLEAGALERWGIAAQCAGDLTQAVPPLERAAIIHSSRGNAEAAARVLISLARIQTESLDLAVAQGCLSRAERLLAGLPQGEQHGHLYWMKARLHLYRSEYPDCIRCAREARELGHRLGNADVESMGTLLWGIGLHAAGDEAGGRALQDEAAAAVLAGNVTPLVGGIVYCGLISSCCNGGDWQRANEWTESFTRWCQRSNIDTFAGACLIHRAEIFAVSGQLTQASAAIQRADPLIRIGAPWALGDSYRLMGDVHLARGELEQAENSYREAYQHGSDPNPGYAELLLRRGHGEEALRSLKKAASLPGWAAMQRRALYLVQAAHCAALIGRHDECRTLLDAAAPYQTQTASGALKAAYEWARAEQAWAQGQAETALSTLHLAVRAYRQCGAALECARIQLRLADLLVQQGDRNAALLELGAAEQAFRNAEAVGYLMQCEEVRLAMARLN